SGDGTLGFVAEATGRLSIWYLPDGELAVTIQADTASPRWLPTSKAARIVSVVAPDATRAAVPVAARGQEPSSWRIIDLDVVSWLGRACELAGRPLTPAESIAFGLDVDNRFCS
ncbi:MAG: hypothetical protein ACR2PK_19965, partial [Acidimicrobiales bacterium]